MFNGLGIAAAMALTAVSAPAIAGDKEDSVPIAIPAPPAGKGQIVFYRPGGAGFAIGCSVNEKGQKVSSLGAGKYFIMVTEPGRHEFSVKSEAKDMLALEVEADETQYAACKIKMGIMVGRPDIRPATEAEFRGQKKLKMVNADDMGPGEGALRPEQVAAALAGGPAAAAPTPNAPAKPQQ
ncbi:MULTISPECIES: DUF2846 domain-containing protein [unclassified Sphingomonas]|jgi:hypothetical protein|uniref:DUF2846 domain-containing protein n=1 Tax=unclassified Sphingomonas TaxID=196159 RepID=UPI0010F468A3|nr:MULTISPECIES: DUF2846 domain-containing protein [unclassified Sphingomonas]